MNSNLVTSARCRWHPIFAWCGLLILLSLVSLGCQASGESGSGHDHELPSHYPQDLEAASVQLKNLIDQMKRHEFGPPTTGETQGASTAPEAPLQLRDLIRWLPDLAADSDLEEQDWLEARAISRSLLPLAEELVAAAPDDRDRLFQKHAALFDEGLRRLTPIQQTFRQLQERYLGTGDDLPQNEFSEKR